MRACIRQMNRGCATAIVAGLVAAACAPASKLTASEIVAKNVAARGGLDAWRKIDTMVWIGHIESDHAPMPSLPFTLEQKRPNKTRMEINAAGEKSVRVFDGTHGWRMHGPRGQPDVQRFTLQELKFAQGAHGIAGALIDSQAKGAAVTLEGLEEIGGRKAYHLTVRATGGNEDIWVDAENWLEIRYDRMADGPAGAARRVSVTYGDYRAVEGLQIPFLIQTGGGQGQGTTPDRMQIEKVVLNAPLDDFTFGNPAAPFPRMRGRQNVAPQAPAWTTERAARR